MTPPGGPGGVVAPLPLLPRNGSSRKKVEVGPPPPIPPHPSTWSGKPERRLPGSLPKEPGTGSAGKEKESNPPEGDIPKSESEEGDFTANVEIGGGVEEGAEPNGGTVVGGTMGGKVDVENQGVVGALSAETSAEEETGPSGESEESSWEQFKLETRLPVGRWMLGEKLWDRMKPFTLLQELAVGGTFASELMKRHFYRFALEGAIGIIGARLSDAKVRKALVDIDVGLALKGALEGEYKKESLEGESPLTRKWEIGGELTGRFSVRPTGDQWYIYFEGAVWVGATKKGHDKSGLGYSGEFGGGAGVRFGTLSQREREERRIKRRGRRIKRQERR